MRGLLGMPDATAEAFAGGWFHSGDLARRDDEGYLCLVDRKKDMIVSGGENIYPAEVERVLREHPAVADVAVVGVPHPRWGETPARVRRPAAGSRATRTADRALPGSTWRATRSPRPSSSSTSCRATRPARSSSASCANQSRSAAKRADVSVRAVGRLM